MFAGRKHNRGCIRVARARTYGKFLLASAVCTNGFEIFGAKRAEFLATLFHVH